jgi:hypothetical protein
LIKITCTWENPILIVAVPALKPEALKQWLKEGDVDKLRQLVTDGQGHRLLGERPPVPAARGFLRTLPSLMVINISQNKIKNKNLLNMLQKVLSKIYTKITQA